MDVVHSTQYNVCMVILAKVELIQGLYSPDLHVTFEPIKYPDTFHDLLPDMIFFQFLDMPLPPGGQYSNQYD